MASSFFFYDLETSGFNPREARVMQFAGQRTDMDLKPIEEPHDYLINLSEDVLPDPDAVLVTGITPQQTRTDGITEVEFLKIFHERIVTPDTIFVGFNSLRFDDEFMRYLHYRNFYDPYEWQWQDGRSRWDMLDVARMTRALRPEGIKWPMDSSGKPSCRLELMTAINGLDHKNAHDALNDVNATIALAELIKAKQPKLFDFLLGMRDKKKIAELVHAGQPFLYTSGKYDHKCDKTTAVAVLAEHPKRQAVLVYDLRHDPERFAKMTPAELAEAWRWKKDRVTHQSIPEGSDSRAATPVTSSTAGAYHSDTPQQLSESSGMTARESSGPQSRVDGSLDEPRLPIKTLAFNRCPAIAPLSVLDEASQKRLDLKPEDINAMATKLKKVNLAPSVLEALEILDEKQQAQLIENEIDVDGRLYEGFFSDLDKTKMAVVRAADTEELKGIDVIFKDQRLQTMLPLYKARNFPASLTDDEREIWNRYKEHRLIEGKENSRLAKYFKRIQEISERPGITEKDKYLLEELTLYGQSLIDIEA